MFGGFQGRNYNSVESDEENLIMVGSVILYSMFCC